LDIKQFDIKLAFLYGELSEENVHETTRRIYKQWPKFAD